MPEKPGKLRSGSSFGERFGQLVRMRRGMEGYTQQKLAEEAFDNGSYKSRISELERGKVANPHPKTVDLLAVALNIREDDVRRLYDETEQILKAPTSCIVDPRVAPYLAVFRDIDASWCPQMVVLPAGEFRMGSPDTDEDANSIFRPSESLEKPQRRVKITSRFALGRYPVTLDEFRRFVEATNYPLDLGLIQYPTGKLNTSSSWLDPGFPQTAQHPVVGVSWYDVKAYLKWLSSVSNMIYRLPTEAEWEYACRAGTTTRYSFGDWATDKDANFGHRTGGTTTVGAFATNSWGLCDMHGNVYEWVEDVWHRDYDGEWEWADDGHSPTYLEPPSDGTAWLDHGYEDYRVVRGGCWFHPSRYIRSASRHYFPPDRRSNYIGLRVARTLD